MLINLKDNLWFLMAHCFHEKEADTSKRSWKEGICLHIFSRNRHGSFLTVLLLCHPEWGCQRGRAY